MPRIPLLVIADPSIPAFRGLDRISEAAAITVGLERDDIEQAAREAEVVFAWFGGMPLLAELWPRAARLRWVHSVSAGLDGVLFSELLASPVVLTNGRGVFSQSLGEFVLGAVLFFAKDFRRMVRSQERGAWDPFDLDELSGQTIGIVGYGDIGRAVARRARAFGMNVLAARRRPELSARDPNVDELVPLDRLVDLVARSDYLVVTAPLTEETRGLIGAREIAALKSTAVVANVGRGAVIDESALIEALRARRIRGAALDVFETEPLPAGHPFFELDNVLLSPHCADHTHDWLDQAVGFFLENFERFRRGEPLRNVVDKKRGY